ncbi:hypothetical protein BDP55DRAFT_682469 [Colletotrichum godetiae]|uniref:Rhodopsin domain-containing protein n=1 Tax=Colletotrichum godetiae TaxID=1209918 RepID=A0AAJ0ACQ9_9PEZI|nr:uncharacterized protein BDP55DRAFT_682469 [Colletotrichum godetiae]KAK1658540.1 hypothetical protein BDP55DRAFT_682469 [Colletotrichum godetiae]
MYIAEAACLLSHGFAQISIALLWLRIIPLNWQMYTGWVIIGVIVIYTLVILGLLIYSGFGDGSTEPIGPIDGTAHSPQLSMAATVASIIAGLMLILIPSLDILGTQMTPTEKRRAILRWCSPVIAILASAVRLFFLTSFPSSPDLTMHAAVAMVLMFAEVNLTIICGNLPATLQTIKRMKSKASSETMAGSGSGRGGRTSHAPRGLDEYPLQSRDETKQPWTGDGDDSSQRGILATHLSTV